MSKANITSSTIEKKDNTMPSAANLINMISGIYTSPLWEEVRYYASSLATLRKIQKAIIALQECGKSAEAFGLVIALHDLTDLDVPEAIMGLEPFPDGIKMFMDEFIADTNDLMCDLATVEFAGEED